MGLDIGTTTTQMIVSRLEVTNRSGPTAVAYYDFSKREILFMSDVVFTPFDSQGNIAVDQIEQFVQAQCARAHIALSDVATGAIIVTGETSKARNARETVIALSQRLGDFVVATAGPNLESVIAGHGSGASAYSKTHAARVLNIDVGGGTSNFAVFEAGRVVDTACLNVGGRLLELNAQQQVTRAHAPALEVAADLWGQAQFPPTLSDDQLNAYAQRLAQLVLEVVEGHLSDLAQRLLMTPPLARSYRFDAIFISGGVGACLDHPLPNATFGDTGPVLARCLRQVFEARGMTLQTPPQTLRATVIGASAHTLSLSGSTIWLSVEHLPLRSVPVLACTLTWPTAADALTGHWLDKARMLDMDVARDIFALMLPPAVPVTYANVLNLAHQVGAFCQVQGQLPHWSASTPLLIVTDADLGKALGNELHLMMPDRPLAVIDEVHTDEGDYLDIGQGIFNGQVVPLTVKSLAFPAL
ncbi:reactivating factor for ethanolamine ammonia lyase [mine drainage metagenome]|uniref:Reactivating factor for ethanolamine ammonia lyase n=1 Tax=mine drainage metagenome TaxID=410659 RepID=A0A1J5PME0_9ZZZZ